MEFNALTRRDFVKGSACVHLVFPLNRSISNLLSDALKVPTVSFARVGGDKAPQKETIVIAEVRIEIPADDVQ